MITRTGKIISALVATLLILSACGGGGGGSDTNVVADDDPTPVGGITRTGLAVAVGPITGFGSVIVNGVTYDTDAAEFTSDGVVVAIRHTIRALGQRPPPGRRHGPAGTRPLEAT